MTYSLSYCTAVIKGPTRILDIIHRNKLRVSNSSYKKRKGQVPDVFEYKLEERKRNEIKVEFVVNHLCTPEFLINDIVLKFPCCSASVGYATDWDEHCHYEVCSDGKDVYIMNEEHHHTDDYYIERQKEEDLWVGECAVASLLEDNYIEEQYNNEEQEENELIEDYSLSTEEEEYYNKKLQEADEEEKDDVEWMVDFYEQLRREQFVSTSDYDKFDIRLALGLSDTEITNDDKENYYIYEEGLDYYFSKEIIIWLNKYRNLIEQSNFRKLEREYH